MSASLPLPERQPAGIRVIFMTEMWERFSYYGMRALLVLYLVNALHMPREQALELYGIYTGLVYLTPMIGGYLADRYLGLRRAAVVGGTVMMLGHFAMAFEPLLHLALGLLIVGNGFFKPNTSAMVGELYDDPNDPRRSGGYTLYYMGVNLGAFLSPLVAGTLGERLGWHWGFASAGVGMALGLWVFLRGQPLLQRSGLKPHQSPVTWADAPRLLAWSAASVLFVMAVLALWPLLSSTVKTWPLALQLAAGLGLIVAALKLPALIGGASTEPSQRLQPDELKRVIALGVVCFFVIFFWMGFEQAGGSMTLFADQQTDRHLLGFEIPASWFQSINPLLIVALAPLMSSLWTRIDRSRYALSDPTKQALGMMVLGLGFVVMAAAQSLAEAQGTVGPLWLVAVYALHTIGELMLSPVGLAMVSRLAPQRLVGLLMGAWMLSSAVANYLAGTLESLLAGSGIPLFTFLLGSSIGAGVLLLLLTPWLNRWMTPRQGN